MDRKVLITTATLTDVPLTINRPDLFIRGRVFDPALDHMLIYGIMKDKAKKQSGKIIVLAAINILIQ